MKKRIIVDIYSLPTSELSEGLEEGRYTLEDGEIYEEVEVNEASTSEEEKQDQEETFTTQENANNEETTQEFNKSQGEEENDSNCVQSEEETPQPNPAQETKDFTTAPDDYIKPKIYEDVKMAIELKQNVLLVGPAGTGKTELAMHIAKDLGLEFYTASSVTDEYQLIGFNDANSNYKETDFYNAFVYGGLFLLDELDNSNPSALVALNQAIANGFFTFPNGKKQSHENFRIIATANTFGNGANAEYISRSQLDKSTLDRFKPTIAMDYDKAIEKKLTKNTDLLNFVRDFRHSVYQNEVQHIVSYRAIKEMNKAIIKGLSLKKVLEYYLLTGLTKDDLVMIKNDMKMVSSPIYDEFDKVVSQWKY